MNMKLLATVLFFSSLIAMEVSDKKTRFPEGALAGRFLRIEALIGRTFSGNFDNDHVREECAIEGHFNAQIAMMILRERKKIEKKMG